MEATLMKTQSFPKLLLYVVLCCTLVVVLGFMAGCKGSDGSNGANGVNGTNGTNGTNGSTGNNELAQQNNDYTVKITGVTIDPGVFTINFSVLNGSGAAIPGITDADAQAPTKLAHILINIAKLLPEPGAGALAPANRPNTWWSVYSENTGTHLTDHGNGTYTYVTSAVPVSGATTTAAYYDSTQFTRVVVRIAPNLSAARSPVVWTWSMGHLAALGAGKDATWDIPNGTTVTQDVVPTAQCLNCHSTFGDGDANALTPHAGEGRVTVEACQVCHVENLGTAMVSIVGAATYTFPTGEAQIGTFIHKIHTSQVFAGGDFDYSAVGFPQDVRHCSTCHTGGTDSSNWMNKPSAKACLSCHNSTNTAYPGLASYGSLTTTGTAHPAGQIGPIGSGLIDDTMCEGCHHAAALATAHLVSIATQTDTVIAAGIAQFSGQLLSATVGTSDVAANGSNPVTVKFRIIMNGSPLTLAVYSTTTNTTNLISAASGSFTSGPDFVVSFGIPQDGITAPSDWNSGHSSVTLLNLWSGASGTLSGPDANGYYTAVLGGGTNNNVTQNVPNGATMATVIFKDSFTQWNVNAPETGAPYPNGVNTPMIPATMTVAGFTPRRQIISAANCNKCHARLGDGIVDPTTGKVPGVISASFHTANYSTEICAACHTPNQTDSSGWGASFRTWVHGIHGAAERSVPYTWQAPSATSTFADLQYPGVLSNCQQCHLPGTFDFSAPQYTDALINNMLLVTSVTGSLGTASSWQDVPYAPLGNLYGAGYSYATSTVDSSVTITQAAGTTLVSTPITATCTACHDTDADLAHMRGQGGYFYAARSVVTANPNSEACLFCHGPGKIAAIADVHASQ